MKDPNDLPPNTDAPDPIAKLLDTFETRMRNVFGDLKQNILAREWEQELRPAPDPTWIAGAALTDPVKRWPFAESLGDLANRIFDLYDTDNRGRMAMLAALRTVLIEQPPRLAPWLDPGAAAKDSARLNLIEIALRHAFPNFFAEGPIEPEVILATGDEHRRNLEKLRAADQKVKGLPVVKIKDGDEWRCYDALFWRPDGVLEVDLAPSADERGKPDLMKGTVGEIEGAIRWARQFLGTRLWLRESALSREQVDELERLLSYVETATKNARDIDGLLCEVEDRGAEIAHLQSLQKPEPSSPLVRDDLSMRLKTFLACENDLNAHDRSLIEEAAGELALTPKPKPPETPRTKSSDAHAFRDRLSKASRHYYAAFALDEALRASNVRLGDCGGRLLADALPKIEWEKIAHAVADAVVGAEQ